MQRAMVTCEMRRSWVLRGVARVDGVELGLRVVGRPRTLIALVRLIGRRGTNLTALLRSTGSCTVTINVTALAMGPYLNTTGTVTSTNDGNSGPATATLIVPGIMQAAPTLSEWALVLLVGLLTIVGGGWASARRQE
jgi:hypothetical protein